MKITYQIDCNCIEKINWKCARGSVVCLCNRQFEWRVVMISRRKAKKWKTLDAWGKNMSIREYINSKIDEIYDGVDRLKDKLKSKDKKIKRIQTNLLYERDWFEELKKQLNAKDEENANLKEELEELDWKFAEYLCHTTRNRISKTYGTAEEMKAVFNQAQSDLIEEIIRENAK